MTLGQVGSGGHAVRRPRCFVQSQNRADEGKQLSEIGAMARPHRLSKRPVFQLAMQKAKMLPPELTLALFGQSIAANRSLMYTHWLCGVSNRQFGSPGSVLPLKGRCEILDATYQESNILELSKPNPLHISEVTNEVTPSASVSWPSDQLAVPHTADQKSESRRAAETHRK